jgi:hypothetical protein
MLDNRSILLDNEAPGGTPKVVARKMLFTSQQIAQPIILSGPLTRQVYKIVQLWLFFLFTDSDTYCRNYLRHTCNQDQPAEVNAPLDILANMLYHT